MPLPPCPHLSEGPRQKSERWLWMLKCGRRWLYMQPPSPTLSREWKACQSFPGSEWKSGAERRWHWTFSAQSQVHSQLTGFVCRFWFWVIQKIVCSWLQNIRVAFDIYIFFILFPNCSEIFHRRGHQTKVEAQGFVFPQLGSLPLVYLFAVNSKHIVSLFLPDTQVPSFVSAVHCVVTEEHEFTGPLFIVLRVLLPRFISLY